MTCDLWIWYAVYIILGYIIFNGGGKFSRFVAGGNNTKRVVLFYGAQCGYCHEFMGDKTGAWREFQKTATVNGYQTVEVETSRDRANPEFSSLGGVVIRGVPFLVKYNGTNPAPITYSGDRSLTSLTAWLGNN